MKQFDLQGNEYDCTIEIPLKKATYEDIQALNINLQTQLFVKDKEIERLNNKVEELDTKWINSLQQEEEYEEGWRELKKIIDEVREYIEELNDYGIGKQAKKELLEILEKENNGE